MPDTSIDRFLSNREGSQEPLLTFKWVTTTLPYGLSTTYVEKVDLPFIKLDVKSGLFGAATYSYYPGFSDIDAFDITFYEDSACSTVKWLQYWYGRIKNFETGTYYLPTNYKENIKVQLLDTTNAPVLEVELVNIWPTTTSNWSLAYDDDGRLTVTQNFSIDDQKLRFLA